MNAIILPSFMGWADLATSQFKPALLHLIIGLVSHPACAERFVNTYNEQTKMYEMCEAPPPLATCDTRPWCNGYRHRKWTQQHEFKY